MCVCVCVCVRARPRARASSYARARVCVHNTNIYREREREGHVWLFVNGMLQHGFTVQVPDHFNFEIKVQALNLVYEETDTTLHSIFGPWI